MCKLLVESHRRFHTGLFLAQLFCYVTMRSRNPALLPLHLPSAQLHPRLIQNRRFLLVPPPIPRSCKRIENRFFFHIRPSQGPESEKLKLMYAAYDVSGVKSSEERSSSAASGIGGGGSKSWKSIPSRRSKFLTVEDITAALATASQDVYPTLFQFSAGGSDLFSTPSACLGGSSSSSGESYHGGDCRHDAEVNKRRSNSGRGGMNGRRNSLGGIGGEEKSETSTDRAGGQGNESKTRDTRVGGSVGRDGVRAGNDREAVEEALKALARRNAANFAERAVSEFGQAQNGALTRKEFEKWALTGPVLRCRINEFSLDVNVVPFQGVRLA